MRVVLLAVTVVSILLASPVNAAAPHYHLCGRVNEAGLLIPVYASQVACSTATQVEQHCRRANCFGQLPMLNKDGSFLLPSPGDVQPLGFGCWQVYGGYTAGLPTIPQTHEASWIRCGRFTGHGSVFYTEFVAYWSQ
jgi:hypothetical protein